MQHRPIRCGRYLLKTSHVNPACRSRSGGRRGLCSRAYISSGDRVIRCRQRCAASHYHRCLMCGMFASVGRQGGVGWGGGAGGRAGGQAGRQAGRQARFRLSICSIETNSIDIELISDGRSAKQPSQVRRTSGRAQCYDGLCQLGARCCHRSHSALHLARKSADLGGAGST